MIISSLDLIHFPSAADGLAAELHLFDAIFEGRRDFGVFTWHTSQALVVPMPITRGAHFAPASEQSAAAGWPVFSRRTGGGTVPQGPGVLNVALALRRSAFGGLSLRSTFALISAPLQAVFARFGVKTDLASVPGAFCDGKFNLATGGRKLAGTAQRWRHLPGGRGEIAILLEAQILYDLPLRPAVSAINTLHERLALETNICEDAHQTLCAALADAGICPDIRQVSEAILAEIIAQTRPRDNAPWQVPSILPGKPLFCQRRGG